MQIRENNKLSGCTLTLENNLMIVIHMKTKLTFCALLLNLTLIGYSQSMTPTVVNAGGKTYTDSSISIEWSIGEVAVVNTMTSVDKRFVFSNGFLQSELSCKDKDNYSFTADELTVLPSPTHGKLDVWIDTRQQGNLLIGINNAAGKEICSRKVSSYGTHVTEHFNLTTQPSGTYFVHVTLLPAPGFTTKRGAYRVVKI
jgi:hypothetical protein